MNIFTVRRSLDNKEKLNLNHRKEFRHIERVYENVKANSQTIHESMHPLIFQDTHTSAMHLSVFCSESHSSESQIPSTLLLS